MLCKKNGNVVEKRNCAVDQRYGVLEHEIVLWIGDGSVQKRKNGDIEQ